MKKELKKILIILGGSFFLIFLLFLTKPQKSSREIPTEPPKRTTPTPVLGPTVPPNLVIPTEFEPTMAFERIYKDFQWEEIGLNLPAGKTLSPTTLKKDSPSRKYRGELSGNKLTVFDASGNSQTTVGLTEEIKEANFVWLTDNYLFLIEKESDFWSVDKVYLIERDKGTKIFVTGSFPIKDRLNLNLDPDINADGTEIIFSDNAGNYWQLTLIYR